jgi:hypothetical protein
MTTQINDDVKRQDAANAEAARRFEVERQRKNAIQNAAEALRKKAVEISRANTGLRKEIDAFKETARADLTELKAANDTLTTEGTVLRGKLATLKMLAGVK